MPSEQDVKGSNVDMPKYPGVVASLPEPYFPPPPSALPTGNAVSETAENLPELSLPNHRSHQRHISTKDHHRQHRGGAQPLSSGGGGSFSSRGGSPLAPLGVLGVFAAFGVKAWALVKGGGKGAKGRNARGSRTSSSSSSAVHKEHLPAEGGGGKGGSGFGSLHAVPLGEPALMIKGLRTSRSSRGSRASRGDKTGHTTSPKANHMMTTTSASSGVEAAGTYSPDHLQQEEAVLKPGHSNWTQADNLTSGFAPDSPTHTATPVRIQKNKEEDSSSLELTNIQDSFQSMNSPPQMSCYDPPHSPNSPLSPNKPTESISPIVFAPILGSKPLTAAQSAPGLLSLQSQHHNAAPKPSRLKPFTGDSCSSDEDGKEDKSTAKKSYTLNPHAKPWSFDYAPKLSVPMPPLVTKVKSMSEVVLSPTKHQTPRWADMEPAQWELEAPPELNRALESALEDLQNQTSALVPGRQHALQVFEKCLAAHTTLPKKWNNRLSAIPLHPPEAPLVASGPLQVAVVLLEEQSPLSEHHSASFYSPTRIRHPTPRMMQEGVRELAHSLARCPAVSGVTQVDCRPHASPPTLSFLVPQPTPPPSSDGETQQLPLPPVQVEVSFSWQPLFTARTLIALVKLDQRYPSLLKLLIHWVRSNRVCDEDTNAAGGSGQLSVWAWTVLLTTYLGKSKENAVGRRGTLLPPLSLVLPEAPVTSLMTDIAAVQARVAKWQGDSQMMNSLLPMSPQSRSGSSEQQSAKEPTLATVFMRFLSYMKDMTCNWIDAAEEKKQNLNKTASPVGGGRLSSSQMAAASTSFATVLDPFDQSNVARGLSLEGARVLQQCITRALELLSPEEELYKDEKEDEEEEEEEYFDSRYDELGAEDRPNPTTCPQAPGLIRALFPWEPCESVPLTSGGGGHHHHRPLVSKLPTGTMSLDRGGGGGGRGFRFSDTSLNTTSTTASTSSIAAAAALKKTSSAEQLMRGGGGGLSLGQHKPDGGVDADDLKAQLDRECLALGLPPPLISQHRERKGWKAEVRVSCDSLPAALLSSLTTASSALLEGQQQQQHPQQQQQQQQQQQALQGGVSAGPLVIGEGLSASKRAPAKTQALRQSLDFIQSIRASEETAERERKSLDQSHSTLKSLHVRRSLNEDFRKRQPGLHPTHSGDLEIVLEDSQREGVATTPVSTAGDVDLTTSAAEEDEEAMNDAENDSGAHTSAAASISSQGNVPDVSKGGASKSAQPVRTNCRDSVEDFRLGKAERAELCGRLSALRALALRLRGSEVVLHTNMLKTGQWSSEVRLDGPDGTLIGQAGPGKQQLIILSAINQATEFLQNGGLGSFEGYVKYVSKPTNNLRRSLDPGTDSKPGRVSVEVSNEEVVRRIVARAIQLAVQTEAGSNSVQTSHPSRLARKSIPNNPPPPPRTSMQMGRRSTGGHSQVDDLDNWRTGRQSASNLSQSGKSSSAGNRKSRKSNQFSGRASFQKW